jgi:hypothetical protein
LVIIAQAMRAILFAKATTTRGSLSRKVSQNFDTGQATSDAFQRPAKWMRLAFSASYHHVETTPISYLGLRSGRPNRSQ